MSFTANTPSNSYMRYLWNSKTRISDTDPHSYCGSHFLLSTTRHLREGSCRLGLPETQRNLSIPMGVISAAGSTVALPAFCTCGADEMVLCMPATFPRFGLQGARRGSTFDSRNDALRNRCYLMQEKMGVWCSTAFRSLTRTLWTAFISTIPCSHKSFRQTGTAFRTASIRVPGRLNGVAVGL
ncbi:hypothetical protein BDN72DRAFT_325123 [Pluteus cervinus]|uniref:Uncharacterized protein n=1 Tax=Pluteus cervinus TaxID=181527 RepID=A0ACD3B463_9AGAR|nr:hypothetical protein BDN72DRAFT_325123 [Pluteus cervinus]